MEYGYDLYELMNLISDEEDPNQKEKYIDELVRKIYPSIINQKLYTNVLSYMPYKEIKIKGKRKEKKWEENT